jgi:hypothetical protein
MESDDLHRLIKEKKKSDDRSQNEKYFNPSFTELFDNQNETHMKFLDQNTFVKHELKGLLRY